MNRYKKDQRIQGILVGISEETLVVTLEDGKWVTVDLPMAKVRKFEPHIMGQLTFIIKDVIAGDEPILEPRPIEEMTRNAEKHLMTA